MLSNSFRHLSSNSATALQQPAPLSFITPRAVLFDLDGTLIDTMQVFADVAADVMTRHHGVARAHARSRYLATSGIPFFQQLEVIAPGDRRNAAAAAEFELRKVEATGDVDCTEATLMVLGKLRGRGIGLGVCSNNFQDQVDQFASRCDEPLDLALGFGNGLAKGPAHFDRACLSFDCSRDDLVFVGDSIADALIARAAGVRFVGKLGTFDANAFWEVAADAPVVEQLSELLMLFV